MSWLCYVKIAYMHSAKKNIKSTAIDLMILQVELAVYSAAFFGQISLIGLFINGPLITVFSVVFATTALLLLIGHPAFSEFGLYLNQAYINLVYVLGRLNQLISFGYFDLDQYSWHIRGVFVLWSGLICLKIVKNLTISSRRGGEYVYERVAGKKNLNC
jgi:hypothetical protein